MSLKKEVAHRFLIWLVMFLSFAGVSFVIGNPLDHFRPAELLIFFLQVLIIGSLISLSFGYFSVKLNDQKISRKIAGCCLLAILFFPDFGQGIFGIDPVILVLLIVLAVSVALNIALYIIKRNPSSDLH